MREIKTSFKWLGLDRIQVFRTTKKALYRVDYSGNTLGYECIKIRQHVSTSRSKQDFEVYPSTEEFGRFAWSYQDYKSAILHYNIL